MKQQPLEITFRQIPRFRDFLVTDCNKVAAAVVRQWPDWPGPYPVLNLIGPPSSGKSHLAAIWRSHLVECQILDRIKPNDMPPGPPFFVLDGVNDFEKWDEEALFHLFNRCKNEKGGLLILSEKPVSQIPWRLADLRSRFRSVNVVHIDLPDDELLFLLLEQFFLERRLVAPKRMLHYLVKRMERSFVAVDNVGTALDQLSIAEKRPLSVSLARLVLSKINQPQNNHG